MLDRESIRASEDWSRWLVPPAALSVHLAIGQAYAWSVFKPPLEHALHLSGQESARPFQLGIVMLGLSAALFGTQVEKRGPRWAMLVSMSCWSSGFLVAAAGVLMHQYWLVVVGYGGIGGIGLGIGYISPVSTLLKWFPDRPGLATGIAIMGFGGGALIASPWSSRMLEAFHTDTTGIAKCFAVLGLAYAVFMSLGIALVRVPKEGWKPAGWTAPSTTASLVTTASVSAKDAIRTPQFWLLWIVLAFNVSAGIGILEKASPMITDMFGTRPAVAAAFVGLLSLSNMVGRIAWSSLSDRIGRKNVYRMYLGVGAAVYLAVALFGYASRPMFIGGACLLLTFYGGGFATIPAYLRDLFGTYQVGAIHGRLLTAWSLAGVVGPLIVNAVADVRKAAGAHGHALYQPSLIAMTVLLVIAFGANELVRPVDARFHLKQRGAT